MIYPPHDAPGSGAQELIGYEIDLSASDGTALITLDVEAKHLNRNGTLHGGIHSMILDAAAGFAASRRMAGEAARIIPVVTLSLTTSFIAPAPQGRVIVRGHATGGGYKIVYADAVVMLEDETILSTGSGVFKRAA